MQHHPFWWDTVPQAREAASTNEHFASAARVDILVIGAGYTGLSAARQLARSGASVVVLERGDIGAGASSRNAGQVLTGLKVDPAALVRQYGESRARELFEVSRQAIADLEDLIAVERIDCEFQRTGHLQAAAKPSHFAGFREEQALLARVFGHQVSLVPEPDQASELGARGYHGLLVDEESRALNPAKYVCGLGDAAARAGAVLADHTAVQRVTRESGDWLVHTDRGTIRARDVLFATNGYTDRAAPALQRRFIPIGSYIIVTAPLSDGVAARILPKRRMAFDSRNFLHYFRLTADNRLLFGGRAEFSGPTFESARRAEAILHRAMASIFPELADIAIDYAWSGHVAFTRDQMPHAGRLDEAFYAGGYCGHGIALATHLGGVIARRIAGQGPDHPMLDDHFAPIPLYYGRPWFLPIVGLYYRWLDWIS
ncbi:MAG TPA: FAD-binding oxidoreductase [Vicinamibacterales bacterium]|nr:FAD-binding oxidoreductase [Vicinamibacterales bacterium]